LKLDFELKLLDAEYLADFIAKNYGKASKIVEVMVGAHPWVAQSIKGKLPNTSVIATDVDEEKIEYVKEACPTLEVVRDDILAPRFDVYKAAELIYSMRPPPELVPELVKLASKADCDLLIRPYSGEVAGYSFSQMDGWKIVKHNTASFYLLKKEHQ